MKALIFTHDQYFSFNIVQCLGIAGVKCHIMASGPIDFLKHSRYCLGTTTIPTYDQPDPPQGIIDQINDYCLKHSIDIIVPSETLPAFFLSKIKDKITASKIFPVSDIELAEKINDKWWFRNFLNQQKVPHPKTWLIANPGDLGSLECLYPIMVKSLKPDWSDARQFDDACSAGEYLLQCKQQKNLPVLVQEFVPGTDIDLSVLADRGKIIAWTVQRWLPGRVLQFTENRQMFELGEQLIAAWGYHGVAHFDMRIDERDGTIYILECNPRLWRSVRGSAAAGVNFLYLGLLLAAGKPMPKIKYRPGTFTSVEMLFRNAVRGKISPRDWRGPTLRNVGYFLLDPFPYVISKFRKLWRWAIRKN